MGDVGPKYGSDQINLPSPGVKNAILPGLRRSVHIHATDRVLLKNDGLPLPYEDDGPITYGKCA